uniref:Uncharacterized protein n=1 Tax=Spongospora subterranea TaxID=70186 RepID=A0A0H5QEY9_9EUKA|eukprot:CRZ00613.1 hypothetical protein [Spongospora subterranea]
MLATLKFPTPVQTVIVRLPTPWSLIGSLFHYMIVESWTVGDRNATTLTKSMYAPHGPADNPPLVDALTKKPAGHRRKSYSPGDSMCLEKVGTLRKQSRGNGFMLSG